MKKIRKAIAEEEERHEKEMTRLIRRIVAPCQWCKYDGVFRCEACEEAHYEGFNIKDYPNGY
jgi:hypothetical protein